MLFSTREIDALKLLRWCRYIPREAMVSTFSDEVLQPLLFFRFITLYRKHDAYVLTGAGNRFLTDHISELPAPVRPSYKDDDYLRRSRTARFALTVYRSGLSLFQTELAALEESGACYLTAQARTRGTNPWGSTRLAALLRLGDMICGAHYIERGIGKLSLTDELNALNNSTARFSHITRGLIYTGESYDSILSELDAEEEHPSPRMISYGEAYSKLQMPVFLIPSNEIGAQQLCLMAQPNYRAKLTQLALGSSGLPPPADRPEWDAMYQGVPFIMAADMDFHRIDAAAEGAIASGMGPAYLVAIKGQEDVLKKRYKATGLAQKVFTFSREKPELKAALSLHTPSDRQYETQEGEVIHVPSFPEHRKNEKQARQ